MTMVFLQMHRQKQGVIINIQAERGSLQKKQTVIIQVEKTTLCEMQKSVAGKSNP